MSPPTGLLGVIVTIFVTIAPTITEAVLPAAPFDFQVSPTTVIEGSPVTLRIAPKGRAGEDNAVERYDIYIMHALEQEPWFLAPTGVWSPQPIPYVEAVSRSQSAPVLREWPKATPVGWIPICMVVVHRSTSPLIRLNWAFQPRLEYVKIRPSTNAAVDLRALGVFGFLGLVSIGASTLVLWQAKSARHPGEA